MAQTETDQQREQREQQEQQLRSQGSFDSLFGDMITQSGIDPTGREAWQAYFDLAEQTLRTARRVSEIQVLSLMQQHIVKQVTLNVVKQLQSNPQIIKPVIQQVQRELHYTS
jgi:hypothetical protein